MITAVVNLALIVVITRGLDSKGAGAVFAVTSVYLIAETAVRLGTDIGIVHFVASRRAVGDGTVVDVIKASIVPVAPAALLGGVAVGFLTPVIVRSLGAESSIGHVEIVALLLAVAVPVGASHDFITAVTRGLGTSRPTVMIERVLRPLLQISAITVAVVAGGSASLIAVLWVLPYFITAPILFAWLRRLFHAQNLAWRSGNYRLVFRQVWGFTLPRSLTSILQILLQRLDIIIVGAILGARAAAIYTGATRFVVVGQLGNQALAYVFQPQLAGLVSQRLMSDAKRLYKVSTVWLISVNAPLYLGVCVTAPILVRLLGPRYHSGTASMIVVTLAALVGSAVGPVDYVLITLGRTSWTLINTVLALVINITIDLVFLSHFGIVAAAVGWAAAIVTTNVIPLAQVWRVAGFSPFSELWVRVMTLALLAFAAAPGVVLVAVGASLPVMVVVLALTTAAYLAVMWRWRGELVGAAPRGTASLRRQPSVHETP